MELRGILTGDEDTKAWWRTQRSAPEGGRVVTKDDPLTVLVAGGGLAGLVVAAACHSKGMKVALFEQASSYAPYGGPIQIQSNALRALQQINPKIYEELVAAGTCTADRVSGLKIGYRKGNKLAGLYDAALEAELPATVVVDRPVIQQFFVKYGFPEGTVRIASRIQQFEDLGKGRGVAVLTVFGVRYARIYTGWMRVLVDLPQVVLREVQLMMPRLVSWHRTPSKLRQRPIDDSQDLPAMRPWCPVEH